MSNHGSWLIVLVDTEFGRIQLNKFGSIVVQVYDLAVEIEERIFVFAVPAVIRDQYGQINPFCGLIINDPIYVYFA